METPAMPNPGLLARDRAKQNHEAPARRIRQARENGDEPVGNTSQAAQVWRMDNIIHPPQSKKEEEELMDNRDGNNNNNNNGLSGSDEESGSGSGSSGMQVEDTPDLSATSSSSVDLTPPSSVSSLSSPGSTVTRRLTGSKRRHEQDASPTSLPHPAPLNGLTHPINKHARHDVLSSSSDLSQLDSDRATTSTTSTTSTSSGEDSETDTQSNGHPLLLSLLDSPPPTSSPDLVRGSISLIASASVSSARPRRVKQASIREEVMLYQPRPISHSPRRAISDPSSHSPPVTSLISPAKGSGGGGVYSLSSSSSSSNSTHSVHSSPQSTTSSLASTVSSGGQSGSGSASGGSSEDSNSPSPPPPPSPFKTRHPAFWSFPPTTPPAHRLDKSSMCHALEYLNPHTLLAVRRTCRLWFEYTYQPTVWSFASSLTVVNLSTFRSIHFPSVSMLRELELTKCDITDSDLSRITVCTSLQLLDVSYCVELTDAAVASIATLRSLQILSLEGCKVGDVALSHLPSLPVLHSLSLSFCPITDYGMQFIAHCSSLEFLQLCYCQQLTGRSLQALSTLPSLTNLNIGHTSFKDDDLPPLHHLTHLISLNMESVEVTDSGLAHLEALDCLTSLNMHEIHNMSDRTLEIISRSCPSLTSLYYSYSELVTDQGLGYLQALAPTLRVLEMPECEHITDVSCEHISHLTQLTTLDLTGCYPLTDQGVHHLASLQRLTLLNLGMLPAITDQAILSLSALPCLISLELNSCSSLTPLSAQYLSSMRTLRSLSASEVSRWDDTAITHLLSLDRLDALCLSGTAITVASLRRLIRMRWMKELNVYGCPNITEEELERIKEEAEGRVAINR